jgi:hypothetical protein
MQAVRHSIVLHPAALGACLGVQPECLDGMTPRLFQESPCGDRISLLAEVVSRSGEFRRDRFSEIGCIEEIGGSSVHDRLALDWEFPSQLQLTAPVEP